MRVRLLLLLLAACGQAPESTQPGASGFNASVGGSFGAFYSHTR